MPNPRVLFVCTANSARSQMAEALLREQAGDRFESCSAGTRPSTVNPMTIKALEQIGIDPSLLRSKGLAEFLGKVRLDFVITVCDNAAESCPNVPDPDAQVMHWPFEDPAAASGSDEERLGEFDRIRDQIDARIRRWVESFEA